MNAFGKGAIATSCATLFIVLAVLASSPADADTITLPLSAFSSDETPADVLDAKFIFSVISTVMRLDVYNETTDPDAYKINQIYFNAKENVTGLQWLAPPFGPPPGWTLLTDEAAGGFGVFDFYLEGGVGNDTNFIQPGEFATFRFFISGTGSFYESDFVTPSTIPPGNIAALAAAKFVQGPDDDSAFGAVPIPGAVWLLGSGLIGLAFIRRKRFVKSLNR